ncbi:PE family protein, partial [Mycobacterium sp. Marseille-P9652]|uniref:PE family protein n=1 Tax=Mycobacterium sp. Marseille-P9652 TaxID=2654950 RepID=UPI001E3F4177
MADIGYVLDAANAAAAARTTTVLPAAADEVSAATAALFRWHGREFAALSAQVSALYDRFVQTLTAAASSYTETEAAGMAELQTLGQDILAAANSSSAQWTGRPLIGNGTDGTTDAQGAGTPGGPGGW